MKKIVLMALLGALLSACSKSPEAESGAASPADSAPMVDTPMRGGESGTPPPDPSASAAPSGTSPGMGSDLSGGIQQAAKGQAREAAAKAGGGSVESAANEGD